MPYQYTGRYTEAATGLVNLDARWYNPHTQRFVQPDLWNFRNTGLPAEIQHKLMRFTGLDTAQLLRDPSQQVAYGYVSGNPLAWTDWLGLCETSLLQSIKQGISSVWVAATAWHFEGRDARNGDLPMYEQAIGQGSEWTLLSPEQSIFHDNGLGNPELKFIHPDGREAVFDGDTLILVTEAKYVGTYNYVNPAPLPDKWYDLGGWGVYAAKGLGHTVLDVAPYSVGGNVRGDN